MDVDIPDAQERLSELTERVSAGDEIVITRGGRPVARRVPYDAPSRRPGSAKGAFVVPPDFDAPLPDHTQASWE